MTYDALRKPLVSNENIKIGGGFDKVVLNIKQQQKLQAYQFDIKRLPFALYYQPQKRASLKKFLGIEYSGCLQYPPFLKPKAFHEFETIDIYLLTYELIWHFKS